MPEDSFNFLSFNTLSCLLVFLNIISFNLFIFYLYFGGSCLQNSCLALRKSTASWIYPITTESSSSSLNLHLMLGFFSKLSRYSLSAPSSRSNLLFLVAFALTTGVVLWEDFGRLSLLEASSSIGVGWQGVFNFTSRSVLLASVLDVLFRELQKVIMNKNMKRWSSGK